MVGIKKYLIVLLMPVLSLFCPLTPGYAETTRAIVGRDLVVHFEKPLENGAAEVVSLYHMLKKELENKTGWDVDFRPTVFLVRETSRFQGMVGNSVAVAVAIPQDNLIVIDYSKMNVRPFTLEATLKHELCHLLLERHIEGDHLPRWLNEGYCQWVSGGVSELLTGDRQVNLQKALLSGRLIPLAALGSGFPEAGEGVILAYEQSKSLLDYMNTEFGEQGIHRVLNNLKDGHSVEGAVLQGLSISLGELEDRWRWSLKGRVTWLTYVAHNLYEILFFAAAVLTVYGSVKLVIGRRRRSRLADDEDEDGEAFGG